MTQPGARFSGAVVGALPEVLVTSSTTATELTTAVWNLALEVGDQQWKEAWSPTRDAAHSAGGLKDLVLPVSLRSAKAQDAGMGKVGARSLH